MDPAELDRHIAEMYRDVANETGRDLHFPTGRALAEAARVLRPGGRLALADIVTDMSRSSRTTS